MSNFGCGFTYHMVPPEVMTSSNATRHQTLNNRDSRQKTIVITKVTVAKPVSRRPIAVFPIVLDIVLPAEFILFKIQCLSDFYVN